MLLKKDKLAKDNSDYESEDCQHWRRITDRSDD